jgi:predicted membrane channel-forming protein YqfA (hemolysin III family)
MPKSLKEAIDPNKVLDTIETYLVVILYVLLVLLLFLFPFIPFVVAIIGAILLTVGLIIYINSRPKKTDPIIT